jgi:hypothetical protein
MEANEVSTQNRLEKLLSHWKRPIDLCTEQTRHMNPDIHHL